MSMTLIKTPDIEPLAPPEVVDDGTDRSQLTWVAIDEPKTFITDGARAGSLPEAMDYLRERSGLKRPAQGSDAHEVMVIADQSSVYMVTKPTGAGQSMIYGFRGNQHQYELLEARPATPQMVISFNANESVAYGWVSGSDKSGQSEHHRTTPLHDLYHDLISVVRESSNSSDQQTRRKVGRGIFRFGRHRN